MIAHKDKIVQERRRSRLQCILHQERQRFQQQARESEVRDYQQIYPIINPENYHNYKSRIADWALLP